MSNKPAPRQKSDRAPATTQHVEPELRVEELEERIAPAGVIINRP
jgi:hypothetical protein